MKISELIKELAVIMKEYGDIKVGSSDYSQDEGWVYELMSVTATPANSDTMCVNVSCDFGDGDVLTDEVDNAEDEE